MITRGTVIAFYGTLKAIRIREPLENFHTKLLVSSITISLVARRDYASFSLSLCMITDLKGNNLRRGCGYKEKRKYTSVKLRISELYMGGYSVLSGNVWCNISSNDCYRRVNHTYNAANVSVNLKVLLIYLFISYKIPSIMIILINTGYLRLLLTMSLIRIITGSRDDDENAIARISI